jgi:hypothetical protein
MQSIATRKLFGLAVALLCTTVATAQSGSPAQQHIDELRSKLYSVGQESLPNNGEKTAATGSRLIGYSMYKYYTASSTFQPVDSSANLYPSATTGLSNQYNSFVLSGSAWVPKYKSSYTYNASGQLTGQVDQTWTSGSYVNTNKIAFTLNSAGAPSDVIYSVWTSGAWVNGSRLQYTYNSANLPNTELLQRWVSGAWVNSYRNTYTRNSAGHATNRLGEGWNSGSWVNDSKLDSTFNSSGGLTSAEFFIWNGTAWSSNGRYLHTLDASNRILVETNQQFTPPSTYLNVQKMTYTYNAAGEVTERVGQNYDHNANAWETDLYKVAFSYNTYGQRTAASASIFKNGTWTYDGYSQNERWYYQTYTIASGVGVRGQSNNIELNLSPVPATDVLHIHMKLAAAEDIEVAVTDMQGRVQQRFAIKTALELDRALYVADMPTGNYFISIAGAQGTKRSQMISITH